MTQEPRLAKHFIYYIATIVFFLIGAITTTNLPWYRSLALPSWMLPDFSVAVIWGVLTLLSAISLSLFWDQHRTDPEFKTTVRLYLLNTVSILAWNTAFFGFHAFTAAFICSVVVLVSIAAIMIHIWRISLVSAVMLAPYLLWVGFAIYITHAVSVLNP